MNENTKVTITIFVVFGVMSLFLIDLGVGDWRQRKTSELFYTELQESGLVVLEGIIESPSVIIVVGTSREFVTTVIELHQDTVYYCEESEYPRHGSFYVFNDAMTMAWKYTPKVGD